MMQGCPVVWFNGAKLLNSNYSPLKSVVAQSVAILRVDIMPTVRVETHA